MKTQFLPVVLIASITSACGGTEEPSDSTEASNATGSESDEPQSKSIEREETAESRFRPSGLEDAVDEMVDNIEAMASAEDDAAVGVVLKSLNQFWRPVSVGSSRALAELEIAGGVQGSTAEDLDVPTRVAEQIGFVEEQRSLNYNAFAIAPHNEELSPLLDEIAADGHPIVTIDSDLPDTARDLYIGTDNAQAGAEGGRTLLEALDGATGRVLVLGNTDPGWVGGYERTNAAVEVLEAAGNSAVVLNSIWTPEDDVAQLVEEIEDDASGVPVVGMIGVFANAHTCATAALEADVAEQPVVVAFDFEPETLAYLEDGTISATHVQRQYYMGYLAAYVAYSIRTIGLELTKDSLGGHLLRDYHVDTGLDVIRAAELAEYDSFITDLGI